MNYKIRRFCNSKAPGLLRITRNSVDEFKVQGFSGEGLVLDEVVDLEDAQELQDDSEDVILCTDENGEVEVTILPVNGGEVIDEELEDEGYYEVSNSSGKKTVKNASGNMTVDELNKFIMDMDTPDVEVDSIVEVYKPRLKLSDHQAIIYKCLVAGGLNLHVKYFPDDPGSSEIYFMFGDKLKINADLYSGHEEDFEFLAEVIREYPVIADRIWRRNVYIGNGSSLRDALATADKWYSRFKSRGE